MAGSSSARAPMPRACSNDRRRLPSTRVVTTAKTELPPTPLRMGLSMIVVTTNDLPGYRVVQHLGVVRGVTVRSRNIIAGFGATLQTLKGGNITIYTKLAEQARAEAYELLVAHANQVGANAILAMRYDANEMQAGVTEVLAYGTAVVVEKSI